MVVVVVSCAGVAGGVTEMISGDLMAVESCGADVITEGEMEVMGLGVGGVVEDGCLFNQLEVGVVVVVVVVVVGGAGLVEVRGCGGVVVVLIGLLVTPGASTIVEGGGRVTWGLAGTGRVGATWCRYVVVVLGCPVVVDPAAEGGRGTGRCGTGREFHVSIRWRG